LDVKCQDYCHEATLGRTELAHRLSDLEFGSQLGSIYSIDLTKQRVSRHISPTNTLDSNLTTISRYSSYLLSLELQFGAAAVDVAQAALVSLSQGGHFSGWSITDA
jgi:hypothetical protein